MFSGRNSAVPPNSRIPSPSPSPSPSLYQTGPNSNKHGVTLRDDRKTRFLQSQHTVRVQYNANLIGAREVLQYYEQYIQKEIRLAPPAPHPSLQVGSRQAKRACLILLLSAIFTVPVVSFAWGPVNHRNLIYAHLSLASASLVQGIAVWEFFPSEPTSLLCYVNIVY
jgi:hypothetical protein